MIISRAFTISLLVHIHLSVSSTITRGAPTGVPAYVLDYGKQSLCELECLSYLSILHKSQCEHLPA